MEQAETSSSNPQTVAPEDDPNLALSARRMTCFGSVYQAPLGRDQYDVGPHDPLRTDCRCGHEKLGPMKAGHRIPSSRRQDDVLLAENRAEAAGSGFASEPIGRGRYAANS